MRHSKIFLVLILGVTLLATGCWKKKSEVSLATDTGFDSLNSTEELAQLPQSSTSSNQQASVEALPIEAAPVTQSAQGAPKNAVDSTATTAQPAASSASDTSLTHQQQIQTALKNAGLYTGPIDGKLGPKTKKAIEAFQKNHNLKADGKVGPKTWSALEPYLNGQGAAAADNGVPVTTENPE